VAIVAILKDSGRSASAPNERLETIRHGSHVILSDARDLQAGEYWCYPSNTKRREAINMSTTSLKLPEELKQRAIAAAREQGVSPHAFMIQAIEHAATAGERRASFVAEAQAAREQTLASGKGYDADEVHAYVKARVAGRKSTKPKTKSWRS